MPPRATPIAPFEDSYSPGLGCSVAAALRARAFCMFLTSSRHTIDEAGKRGRQESCPPHFARGPGARRERGDGGIIAVENSNERCWMLWWVAPLQTHMEEFDTMPTCRERAAVDRNAAGSALGEHGYLGFRGGRSSTPSSAWRADTKAEGTQGGDEEEPVHEAADRARDGAGRHRQSLCVRWMATRLRWPRSSA